MKTSQFLEGQRGADEKTSQAADAWRGSRAAYATGFGVGLWRNLWERSRMFRLVVCVLGVVLLLVALPKLLVRWWPEELETSKSGEVSAEQVQEAYAATMTRSAMELYPTAMPAGVGAQPVAMVLRPAYDTSGPDLPYRDLFIASGKEYDIPWLVLAEIARRESAFKPRATNWSDGTGSRGLAQFIPSTWREMTADEGLTWDDAYIPEHSIRMQAKYFDQLRRLVAKPGMSEADIVFAACCAFNWGPGNVLRLGADASPARTRNYAAGILKAAGYLDD